ncbi:MAG: hypothetical protein KJ710_01670 [Candidatus Omnitrophica bacterium]|nr:hypothetical protein [Candidatus Omnitrophota bacterium]MBU1922959.1 hypothetical protein [Candidatus Omnitrophota bacterium]
MQKHYLISTFILIFSLFIASSYLSGHKVYAQLSTDSNPTAQEEKIRGFDLTNVTLAQEQSEKIKALEAEFKLERKNINQGLAIKLLEKTTLLNTYPLDAEKIIAQQKEINQLYSELQDKLTICQIKMAEVLTEEQFKEFKFVPKKRARKRAKQ